jgi:RNA polymerase sigma-54 factor
MAQDSRQLQTQAQQLLQTLSPQQILVVKLLELPVVELEARIHSEILDNPALEEGKEMNSKEEENTAVRTTARTIRLTETTIRINA